jgi:hypothetical protein
MFPNWTVVIAVSAFILLSTQLILNIMAGTKAGGDHHSKPE